MTSPINDFVQNTESSIDLCTVQHLPGDGRILVALYANRSCLLSHHRHLPIPDMFVTLLTPDEVQRIRNHMKYVDTHGATVLQVKSEGLFYEDKNIVPVKDITLRITNGFAYWTGYLEATPTDCEVFTTWLSKSNITSKV